MLVGVQGAGKSLAAKAVAGLWGLPLLRLDFACLYNKYFGETERNLREALRLAHLDARRLELEVTENVMLNDVDGALRTMTALKELGVRLNMDDFGTGYSSLGYLRTIPSTASRSTSASSPAWRRPGATVRSCRPSSISATP